jgi:hypothetical protein
MEQIILPTDRSAARKAEVTLQGFILRNTLCCDKKAGWDKHPMDVTVFVVATEGVPRWDDWHVVVAREREARKVACFVRAYPPGQNPEVSITGRWVSRRIERNLNRGGQDANLRADSYLLANHVRFVDCSSAMRKKADELLEKEKGYRP